MMIIKFACTVFSLLLLFLSSSLLFAQAPKQPMPADTKIERNLPYGLHERNVLDLYVPPSAKPLPLVVWIHGGAWEAGSKDQNPALFLLNEGYAVAGINYRYSTQAPFPAQLHDCQASLRFLRENAVKYNLDAEHIGVWGASAGGHLVSLLGTTDAVEELNGNPKSKTSIRVQAVVNWFGPADMTTMAPPGVTPSPIKKLLGGELSEKQALAKLASPVHHANKAAAPHLIVHGTADPVVPLKQSEVLHEALKKAGAESELVVFPNASHGDAVFRTAVTSAEHRQKFLRFLKVHLKPE